MYWLHNEPDFAKQAVFLDWTVTANEQPTLATLKTFKAKGIQIVAPPIFALLTIENGMIVPSEYAKNLNTADLDIITWSLERSGVMASQKGGWYFQSVNQAVQNEGDILVVLDVLAKKVGIRGIFSDWPATVTYYANCMGLD